MIVGLGNPGPKYALNRHNIGFLAVDYLCQSLQSTSWKDEQKGLTQQIKWNDEKILVVKPQTFMNRSGECVQPLLQYYKIDLDHLIVLHDEVDQGFGAVKIQRNRGHGGHNGIRDISEKLGSPDYFRIRVGVGRPTHPEHAVADYVLANFSQDEMSKMNTYMEGVCDSVESLIFQGPGKAMSLFNRSLV